MYCYNCMSRLNDGISVCPFCGKNTNTENISHHLTAGTVLNGKYLVGESIGEGGFGITYVGLNINLDLKIAIKEYYPYGYANRNNTLSNTVTFNPTKGAEFFKKGMDKFLLEAKSIAKFSGEKGIVYVSDFFKENDTAYIIMEYLDGITLSERVKQGVITPEETIRLMLPLMQSLDRMHTQQILHRDISPDNIMLLNDGTLKLMDFGSARYFSDADHKTMSVMLKPGYAPYEQYYSKGNQGPWTDVYGICATMYKCITGKTPVDSLERIRTDELKKPSELGVNISEKFEQALMSGLEVYPENRCQSMRELIERFSNNKDVESDDYKRPDFKPESEYSTAGSNNNSANKSDDENKTVYADDYSKAVPGDNKYNNPVSQYTPPKAGAPEKDKDSVNYKANDTTAGSNTSQKISEKTLDKKKPDNTSKIGCIGIILIIAAIIGFFFLINHKNYSFDEKTGTLTVTGEISDDDISGNLLTDIKHIVIEDGVKSIGDGAFKACNYVESIKIPDSVTSIGKEAFAGCYVLKEIKIPEGVEKINYGTFFSCRSIEGISIPDTVTSIDEQAFYDCESIEVIKIPDSVKSIGADAFYDCKNLSTAQVPESVTTIGSHAFGFCSDSSYDSSNFAIFGKKNSAAEDYAEKYDITFFGY